MAQRRPLKKHTCECCNRNFFSRSNRCRFCSVQCQVRTWRANKLTQLQLEQQFTDQETERAMPPEMPNKVAA